MSLDLPAVSIATLVIRRQYYLTHQEPNTEMKYKVSRQVKQLHHKLQAFNNLFLESLNVLISNIDK